MTEVWLNHGGHELGKIYIEIFESGIERCCSRSLSRATL
jgi:hypothetical protein